MPSSLIILIPIAFLLFAVIRNMRTRRITLQKLILQALVVTAIAIYFFPHISWDVSSMVLLVLVCLIGEECGRLLGKHTNVVLSGESIVMGPSWMTPLLVGVLFIFRFLILYNTGEITDARAGHFSSASGYALALGASLFVGLRIELLRRARVLLRERSRYGDARVS